MKITFPWTLPAEMDETEPDCTVTAEVYKAEYSCEFGWSPPYAEDIRVTVNDKELDIDSDSVFGLELEGAALNAADARDEGLRP